MDWLIGFILLIIKSGAVLIALLLVAAYLVLVETYDDGWSATVDGRRAEIDRDTIGLDMVQGPVDTIT